MLVRVCAWLGEVARPLLRQRALGSDAADSTHLSRHRRWILTHRTVERTSVVRPLESECCFHVRYQRSKSKAQRKSALLFVGAPSMAWDVGRENGDGRYAKIERSTTCVLGTRTVFDPLQRKWTLRLGLRFMLDAFLDLSPGEHAAMGAWLKRHKLLCSKRVLLAMGR